jgi:dTDP-4-amino-4,6-dideoxygalactose transaminase/lipopolysaccharide/colanic/teichoic acid biosynthesis glycosyltransferase
MKRRYDSLPSANSLEVILIRQRGVRKAIKVCIDRGVAAIALLLFLPLISFIAFVIRVFMGQPVFFRQQRPGYLGRPFTVLKFRTMTVGDGGDDVRLTKLGRLLRKTSLDELPQLWNVLRGDLSLVGPRPLLMQYLERYTPEQARRHEVLPGLTGWAQINGRNAIGWEEKFALDVWYVDHWSLTLDFKILLQTIRKIVRREGISAPGAATMTEFRGSPKREPRLMPRIYLSPPHMDIAERPLLLDAFDSNWIAPLGPHVDAFEKEICTLLGLNAGAATSSGTGALHLALLLLGVERGDTVICSSLTFAASANPVVYCGANPIFIDADAATWNMDPDLLEEEMRTSAKPPKAIIIVDLYGQCADYDRILPIAEKYGVPVIEDAAEALGSTYRGQYAGSFGQMAVLSFNGNKIITTSGGGMLVSNDAAAVARARFLATQARDPAPHYQHSTIGYNYRLSNLLAAVGRGQLRALPQRVEARRRVFDRYVAGLGDLPGFTFMPEADYGRSNRWLTCVLIDPEQAGTDRETIRLALEAEDIEARPVWKPLHLQPVFADVPMRGGEVSERLFHLGLCLPSGSNLSEADQDRIIDIVRKTVQRNAGVTVG